MLMLKHVLRNASVWLDSVEAVLTEMVLVASLVSSAHDLLVEGRMFWALLDGWSLWVVAQFRPLRTLLVVGWSLRALWELRSLWALLMVWVLIGGCSLGHLWTLRSADSMMASVTVWSGRGALVTVLMAVALVTVVSMMLVTVRLMSLVTVRLMTLVTVR